MPSPSHEKMPSPSDPQTFQCALDMLVTAWKEKYPTVKFPIESVCFLPMSKSPLAPQPTTEQGHQHSVQVDCGRDVQLSSGHVVSNVPINYCLVVNSDLSRFRRDRAFVSALKKVVSMRQNTPTSHTRHLLGAFAASHPQISTIYQEQIIALARFSLLLEVKAVVEYGDTSWQLDFRWLTLENVANSSPSCSALTNWVVDLARDQYLIFSQKMLGANLFCQSDGGQKGQEVRLFTMFDTRDKSVSPDGSICQFWADLTFAGKKSLEVADAVKHSMAKFGVPTKELSGLTADSGSGTPESFANACKKIEIWGERATEDSCGLHDLQSVFRLALQQYVGEGGLDARNAIQLLHTIFSFYKELKGRWSKAAKAVWKKQRGDEQGDDTIMLEDAFAVDEIPRDLLKAMQEPLITRWWTIAVLAVKAQRYLPFFIKMAKGVRNMTTTKEKENTIASNLLSLAASAWIVADVMLIASLSKLFLNNHMKWYQGVDPNIGQPGFLAFHRAVRYFLMLEDLEAAESSWETHGLFQLFVIQVECITNEKFRQLKQESVRAIIKKMIHQVHKHNKRYVQTSKLVRGVFAEQPTGQAIAQFLSTRQDNQPIATQSFFSQVHDRHIDVVKFSKFLRDEISEETLQKLQADPLTIFHRDAIELLATERIDIWDQESDNQSAHLVRKEALLEHAAHCSTQHNNERLVKLGALMASTGKSEIMAGVFAVASNDFMTEFFDKEEEEQVSEMEANNNGGEEEQQSTHLIEDEDGPTRRKRGHYRGKKKLFDLQQILELKEYQLAEVALALGPIEFAQRQSAITKTLLSKVLNLKEKEGTEKVAKMMSTYDNNRAPNAQERLTGEDIPPRLLGYFLYSQLGLKANLTHLERELEAREVLFDRKLGVRKKLEVLKLSEQRRFEAVVDADLRSRGYECHPSLKLPAKIELVKQDAKEKEQHVGGEYDVDMSKFFKLVSTDVDKTIFDDC
jgi:hypothetical protein